MTKGFGILFLSLFVGFFAQAEELLTSCRAQNRSIEIHSAGTRQFLVKFVEPRSAQDPKARSAQGDVSAKVISIDLFHQDPKDPYDRSVSSGNLTAFFNKTKNSFEGTLFYQNHSIPLTCLPLR